MEDEICWRELKMKLNRRFLRNVIELLNGWLRIRLLRRNNLILVERVGDSLKF